ncbi:MAG: hypothetical protein JWP91_4252 [Fibrobacteres bacterium]|nr:hypothetical protein [Fibrobacterota bacterium]
MDRRMLSAFAILLLTGCYGGSPAMRSPPESPDPSFAEGARSLPLSVLGVAQSYASGSLAGFSLFNLVGSWSGSDPTTLKTNMKEIQAMKWEGRAWFMIATPNRLDICASMEGGDPAASLWFDPGTLAWYAQAGAEKVKLAEWKDSGRHALMLIRPDGTKVAVRP